MDRVGYDVQQPGHILRCGQAHRHVENLLGQLDRAFHLRSATGHDQPGGHHVFESAPSQVRHHKGKQLPVPRFYNLGEGLPGQPARSPVSHAWNLDGFITTGQLLKRAGVLDLDVLCMLGRCAQGHCYVIGHLVSRNRYTRGMADGTLREHGNVGCARADIHQAYTQVLLVLAQGGETGCQGLHQQFVNHQTTPRHAFTNVLGGAEGGSDYVHVHFKPDSGHANGLLDSVLVIQNVLLGQHMQDFLVCRHRDGARGLQHPVNIAFSDFLVLDGYRAVGIQAADVIA